MPITFLAISGDLNLKQRAYWKVDSRMLKINRCGRSIPRCTILFCSGGISRFPHVNIPQRTFHSEHQGQTRMVWFVSTILTENLVPSRTRDYLGRFGPSKLPWWDCNIEPLQSWTDQTPPIWERTTSWKFWSAKCQNWGLFHLETTSQLYEDRRDPLRFWPAWIDQFSWAR